MTRIVGSYHHNNNINEYRRSPPFSIQSSLSSKESSIISTAKDEEPDYWSTPAATSSSVASSASPPKLKASLEDQIWYHGKIKRINAINLLKYNGDFLVRDSISNPGDYVLTGLCRDEPMHFEIHRAPSSAPNISLFYFEDEQFRSVVDLIQFYFNHRRQVTTKSQFILCNPVINTDKPLNKYQMEVEATYAPFINKHAPPRYDRSLSQKTIINQAKKRLNGSEHDLMHLLAAASQSPSSSNHLTSSKSFGHLNKTTSQIDFSPKSGIKVTSFGVDENDDGGFCVETTYIPPKSSRPIPKFPPPKSPIALPEDLDDYDDLDYEAMEEEQIRLAAKSIPQHQSLIRSPPAIPPKPLSLLKQKRHSEFIDFKEPQTSSSSDSRHSDPSRKHSAHSLFHPSGANRNSDEMENAEVPSSSSLLPAYLDRTQSCQNLVYRQRTKSGNNFVSTFDDDEDNSFRRYPSVKIDPPPLLPTRSKESLSSISVLAIAEKQQEIVMAVKEEKKQPNLDYDDLKIGEDEDSDYDKLKDPPKSVPSQSPPESSQIRPKQTFAQLRAISQPPRQIRHLLNYFSSITIEKLSLLITSEDVKVFQLSQNSNNHNNNNAPSDSLKKLFMAESRCLREEVLDRNACLQLTVAMTIQKSLTPKEVIKVWILTAAHLLQKIGNGFAFGAIMASLIAEKKKRFSRAFAELEPSTVLHFRSLVPIYEDFLAGKMPPSIASCFLPFIQPLLQLFAESDYIQANKLKNINSHGLDNLEILSNLILLARHVLFENSGGSLEKSIESSDSCSGPNPFSTDSLIHCLLATPLLTEPRESDRRKIRQMFEQNNN